MPDSIPDQLEELRLRVGILENELAALTVRYEQLLEHLYVSAQCSHAFLNPSGEL